MTANGDHADSYEATIDATIASLTEAAEAAQRLAAEKRNEYDAALDQAKRLQKALDALQPKPTAKAGASSKGSWTVGSGKVDQVRAALDQLDGPFTVNDAATVSGVSSETARRALDQLRTDEVVRLVNAGGGRGQPRTYGLMP